MKRHKVSQLGRPLIVLLLGVLLTHLGNYLVLPMLPIMLKTDAKLSLTQIGTILASIAIAFQIGSVIGGFLADRIGRRFIIGLGAAITAAGIIGFGIFSGFNILLLMAIIVGLGNGLNAPSTKASIAAFASEENQTTAFSLRGIAANIGTAIAGLIIFFLITGSSRIIFWLSGIIFLVFAIISWFFLPKKCGDIPCPPSTKGAYKKAFQNKPFLVFSLVTIFVWAIYAQLALVLPIRATEVLPDPRNVALVFTINSIIVIFTQNLITKKIINHVHPLTSLSLGVFFVSLGISALFFTQTFIHLVICGAIFVIGEMLILPTVDSSIARLSKAEMISLFFAAANVVYGIGEAAGKSGGGILLEIGEKTSNLPWMVYSILGLVLIITLLVLRRWKPLNSSLMSGKHERGNDADLNQSSSNRFYPFNWQTEVFLRNKNRLN